MGKQELNHGWMVKVFGEKKRDNADLNDFAMNNIGTVHTFQGKEASTVIICMAASQIRKTTGGIKWGNSKPNLLNVAVTRSKYHLFVVGNGLDWEHGQYSRELQAQGMHWYANIDALKSQSAETLIRHFEIAVASRLDRTKDIIFDHY